MNLYCTNISGGTNEGPHKNHDWYNNCFYHIVVATQRLE